MGVRKPRTASNTHVQVLTTKKLSFRKRDAGGERKDTLGGFWVQGFVLGFRVEGLGTLDTQL